MIWTGFRMSAQNETSKWYFGNLAALDFVGGPPVPLAGSAMNTNFSSSVGTDAAGNLQFYTDGTTVWNRLNLVMGVIPPAFTPVGGQRVLVVKQPGNTNIYFVFTQSGNANGLRYSIVDMNLAAGFGALTALNVPLLANTNSGMAAVRQCNGDIWVLAHQYNTSTFYSFNVTATGVNTTPVVSAVGPFSGAILSAYKFSQQGNKVLVYLNASGPGSTSLYDFNLFTGQLSNPVIVPVSVDYGEFSPDGSKLYTKGAAAGTAVQWDLCQPTLPAVLSASYIINGVSSSGDFLCAQDGKLYVANSIGNGSLSVINNPNLAGAACNFQSNAVSLGAGSNNFVLPNFVAGYVAQTPPLNAFITSVSCQTLSCNVPVVCTGPGYTLSAFQWNFGDSNSPNNTSNQLNPVHVYQNAGSYTVQLTASLTSVCGPTTVSRNQVIVVSQLNPTISVTGGTYCVNETASLTANTNACSYNWTGPNAFSTQQTSTTFPAPTASLSGTYTFNTVSAQGCPNTAIASLLILPLPPLTMSLSSHTLCAQAFNGSANTVTLSGNAANTYTLLTPNVLSSYASFPPNYSLTTVPPYSSTLMVGTATLIGSNGGCSASVTAIFTVVPNPTVTITTPTPVICAGESFTYTSQGATSYTWGPNSPGLSSYTSPVVVASPTITSVYTVYGGSLGCNSPTQTTTLTVYPIPTLTLSAGSKSICLNSTTSLTASGTGIAYQWSPGTGLSATAGSLVMASPATPQSYTVIASSINCSNSAVIHLGIWPLPVPKIEVITPTVCLRDQVRLTGLGGTLYDWAGPAGFNFQGQYLMFSASTPVFGGQYTLTVTDNHACKNSATASVQVLPLPSGDFLNFKEDVCTPYCGRFNFVAASEGQQLASAWMIGNQVMEGSTFDHCFTSPGNYSISGIFTDEKTGCRNSALYWLRVHPSPAADFSYMPLHPREGLDEVVFTNNSSGEQLSRFNWYFTENGGYTSDSKDVTFIYPQAGQFKVALVVANTWGCADTTLRLVDVDPDFGVYVPNTFTPNNDRRNDVFMPVIRSAKNYDLKIFDRWGELLFHTYELQGGWDGTFRGEDCKQDSYAWKMELTSMNGQRKIITGQVNLIR